jgi:hypothetical protein
VASDEPTLRILLQLIAVFGIPTSTILVLACTFGWLDPDNVVINIAIVSIPQALWAVVCLAKIIPRSVYYGGLIAAHAFLIYIVWSYFLVGRYHDEYHEDMPFLIGLVYLPWSSVVIPSGALIGYIINWTVQALRKTW